MSPPCFRGELKALADHRCGQGLEVVIADPPVKGALSRSPRRPNYLLIVGDAQPANEDAEWYVATQRRSQGNKPSAPASYASDAEFGCAEDGLLDIAVGRLPGRDPAVIATIVRKIVAYESRKPSTHDLHLLAWLGSPGFGPGADVIATDMFRSWVLTHAPLWSEPWFLCANEARPFCGWPPDEPALFVEQMQAKGGIHLIAAHGLVDTIHIMRHQKKNIRFTAASLKNAPSDLVSPSSPLFLFTCYSGSFDAPRPCLATQLLHAPNGPVCVVGSAAMSHPVGNYLAGQALLSEIGGRHSRLGDLWRAAMRRLPSTRDLLLERIFFDASTDVEQLLREHALMYAMLGDPATRNPMALKLDALLERKEGAWAWTARKPPGATELEVAFRPELPGAFLEPAPPEREAANALLEQANRAFAFEVVARLGPDAPWSGTISREGLLRLTAVGPSSVSVAVLELSR